VSTLINLKRDPESKPISPFALLAGYEPDPEDEEKDKLRVSIKHAIAVAFTQMRGASPEQIQAEKARMIERMKADGVEDPEGLIREVFPDL
jgi:hypothetical protein